MEFSHTEYETQVVNFSQINNITPPTTSSSYSNKLTIQLPTSSEFIDAEVALVSLYVYNSWFNITAALGNNTLYYQVPTSTTTWSSLYPVFTNTATPTVISDGLYEITDLNSVLQYTFQQNGHYFIDANGNNQYPIVLASNPNQYCFSATCLLISNPLPTGWTYPSGSAPNKFTSANTYNATICRLVIPTTSIAAGSYTPGQSSMAKLLGFAPGNYPSGNPSNSYTQNVVFNGTTPQISVVNNVNVACNLVNLPSSGSYGANVIYSFASNVSIGNQINVNPQTLLWVPVTYGHYNRIQISFLTDYFQPLSILDPAISATLWIRKRKKPNRSMVQDNTLKRLRQE